MINDIISVVRKDTFLTLSNSQPFSSDFYHQLVYATDTQTLHRVKTDGTITEDITADLVDYTITTNNGSNPTITLSNGSTTSNIDLFVSGAGLSVEGNSPNELYFQNTAPSKWTNSLADIYRNSNVGIGNTNPDFDLDILYSSNAANSNGNGIKITNSSGDTNSFSQVLLQTTKTGNDNKHYLRSVLTNNNNFSFEIHREYVSGVVTSRSRLLNLNDSDYELQLNSDEFRIAGPGFNDWVKLNKDDITFGSGGIPKGFTVASGILQQRINAFNTIDLPSVRPAIGDLPSTWVTNLNGTGQWLQLPSRSVKSTNTSRTNAAVTSDADLIVEVPNSGLYRFKSVMLFETNNLDTDFRYRFDRVFSLTTCSFTKSNDTGTRGIQGFTYTVASEDITDTHIVTIEGVFNNPTAGNDVSIEWGTNGTNTITLLAGSYLEIEKI